MPIAPLRFFGAMGHVFVARGLGTLLSLVLAAPAFAQAPPDIAHLAPKRAFLIVNVPDFSQLKSAFDKSALGDLWHEPEVATFLEDISKEEAKKFTDFLQDVGIRTEDLKPPTGELGLAIFMPEAPPRPADKKDDTQSPQPDLLAIADMGANADSLQDSLDRLLDRAVKDKRITTEEDTYAGAKITTIKPIVDESKTKKFKPPRPNLPEGEGEEPPDDQAAPSGLEAMNPLTKPRDMHLARSGASFLVSTDRKSLENALDAMGGGGGGKGGETLADEPNYRDALAQLPQTGLVQAVLMGEPVIELLRQDMAAGAPGGDAALPGKFLDAIGVSSIKAFSLGARLDTPDGALDLSFGILAPEKKGLLKLFSQPLGLFDPPGFVPPDAAEVMRFSFRFDGLFDLLRAVAATMPEPTRQQMTGALDAGANIVKPALDTAGPTVHTFTTYRQPLAQESEATTIAIDIQDQATVLNTLVFATGQMKILEPRDFEGNTIYASDRIGLAIGVGFNRVFVGPVAGVENAMRLAGRADAPRITAEPAFREATRTLSDDTVFAQFYDTAQHLKWSWWQWQNQAKADEDQVAAAPIPEDQKAEILRRMRENTPAWPQRLPPVQTVLKYLGDFASDLRATPDGFRGRTIMLRPAAK